MTPRLYPVARYTDARGAIAFFERAFGFTPRAVYDAPDGSVAHAELTFGTGAIGFSSAGPVDPSNVWTTVRDGVYACIADPDAHYARARAAGAEVAHPLHDTSYGSRDYTARDLDGRLWGFGTYAMSDAQGAATFVPEIRCRDGAAAVQFLERAFGLTPGLMVNGPDGALMHGELWLGDSPIFVAAGDHGAELWQDQRQCTEVFVEDPDGHYERARAGGATIVQPPHDTPYGARAYLAQDPEGSLWGFSTYRPRRPD